MKRYIPVALLFVLAASALAIPFSPFRSWDNLVEKSPEIFIARCVSTLDFISATNSKPTIVIDNMINSEVEVVSVLKGQHVLGASRMTSQYWPYRGEVFLVFANYNKNELNDGYTAIEDYRVIPLGHNFMTNQLTGRGLDEQINLVLARRLDDLNGDMIRDREEKARLEDRLKRGGKESDVSSNSLPSSPKAPAHRAEF